MNYRRARTIEEVLARLASSARPHIVCGATDVFADASLVPSRFEWLDISRVDALCRIERCDETVRIGAASTWEAILNTGWLPASLTQAAACVGSRQIRVQGTIGGNLCHASPVADGVPPLLALDAQVELASMGGVRRLPLTDFIVGGGRTALQADELLVAVLFARPQRRDRTAFVKCANRDGPAIAVVSAAVHVRVSEHGEVQAAAVAVGGASAVAVRMRALEASLARRGVQEASAAIEAEPFAELAPIDDCRGTASHRVDRARVAVMRAFKHCIEEPAHGAITA